MSLKHKPIITKSKLEENKIRLKRNNKTWEFNGDATFLNGPKNTNGHHHCEGDIVSWNMGVQAFRWTPQGSPWWPLTLPSWISKVVTLGIADEPKTLSYKNIQTLTTWMPRLVPSLVLSRLYPWGTRQWHSWPCPPSRSSPLVTWWPVTYLLPSKVSHTFVVSKPLPSLPSITQNLYL